MSGTAIAAEEADKAPWTDADLRGRGARTRDVVRELQRVRAAAHGERERAAAPAQQLRDALRARAVERLPRDVRQLVAHLPLGY